MKKLFLILTALSACFPGYLFAAAGQGVSSWTAQSEAIVGTDLVGITDVSDTTQSDNGSSKKATMTQVGTFMATLFEPIKGDQDNFVTDAQLARLGDLEATDDVSFSSVTATGSGGLKSGVQSTTQGALTLYTNVNPYAFGILPAASPTGTYSLRFPAGAPAGSNYLLNFDADGTGGWTDPATLGGDDLGAAAFGDVVGLWTTCTDGYLKFDGSCSSPSSTFTGDASDIPIVDTNNLFEEENVNAVLQAIGAELAAAVNLTFDAGTMTVTGTAPNQTVGVKSGVFEAADGDITKLNEAETITADWVNTAYPWSDDEVSNTLTASLFVGSGSTTTAVDLATAEVAGVLPDANVATTLTREIYSGTATLGTVSIANGACATGVVVSPAATGVANTDVPSIGYQTDPIGTDGHDFTVGPVISIIPRATANTITVYACNYTGATVVPELMVVNVRVDR